MKFPSIGRAALSACTLLIIPCLPMSVSAEGIADKITVNDPYVRAVPPVIRTTGAFMQIQNKDEVEHFVVGAEAPDAGAVELHTHIKDGEVMRMRQVADIRLPPNETVSLQPGGLHIMLFDLTTEIAPDDEVRVTLVFDDGSKKSVSAIVRTVQGMMKH